MKALTDAKSAGLGSGLGTSASTHLTLRRAKSPCRITELPHPIHHHLAWLMPSTHRKARCQLVRCLDTEPSRSDSVESDHRVRSGQPRLRPLLCADNGEAVERHGVREVSARRRSTHQRPGVRAHDAPGCCGRSAALAYTAPGVRQLHVRSVPPGRDRRVRR